MDEATQPETASSTIVEALGKNRDATAEVKKVADNLLVVQAVLKEEIVQDTQTEQTELVDRAVEHAGELEKRLTKSAELLDEVNESLEQAAQDSDGSDGGSDRSPPPKNGLPHLSKSGAS
ncbi:hypothetical protein AB4Z46_23475 [Variovorax sp. M-6]|uniref:hypothetical protein n=1 Tax=Variovorax sp. M-6 TaxID=3233041 RepID=UPI003F944948